MRFAFVIACAVLLAPATLAQTATAGSSWTLTSPSGSLADDFHIYAVEWSANQIAFYVDDNLYATEPTVAGGVFDFPTYSFFLILNVAAGGSAAGAPDKTTKFPQDMLADYVRVYQAADTPAPAINVGGVVDAATSAAALAPGSRASVYGQGLSGVTNSSTFDTARRTLSPRTPPKLRC